MRLNGWQRHYPQAGSHDMGGNLLNYLPRLTKQGCRKAVAAALRKYNRSRYGTIKYDGLALVPHEDAKAAVRIAVQKTGRQKFRTALGILKADQSD
jgi:hypothetical protein